MRTGFATRGSAWERTPAGTAVCSRSDHQELQATGFVFAVNDESLRRWRDWWRYTLIDQGFIWAAGCAVGMFLNVNIALQIIPPGTKLLGTDAGTFQAEFMAKTLWNGFWFLCLLNGFWILLSTQISNTEGLVRTTADILWAASPQVRKHPSSRLYASILLAVIVWGVAALAIGENALSLFTILGVFASPILAIAAIQILRVNTRFLPPELQPPMWSQVGLVACGLFYGTVSVMLAYDVIMKAMS